MVRIIVGEDPETGEQLVYEAGNNSARTLEINNPYGTQEIANAILAKLSGFQYRPYTADGALLNPSAELGDGITFAGDVYSFIASTDTTISPIMSSTVAAYEDSELNHEYPYETRESQEISRKINGLKTTFTVELGKVQSTIEENYETKTEAGETKAQLQTQITQTQSSILSTVSATYETKTAATQMESRLNTSINQTASSITSTVSATYETKANATAKLNEAKGYTNTQTSALRTDLQSQITQTADSITSTVSKAVSKYELPSGITFQNFGYGAPKNSTASGKNGQYYLDQLNGYYYKSNGTSWVRQSSTRLPLITDNLRSQIQQTADSISLQVSGANAPEWESGDYFSAGDVVKITTYNSSGLVVGTQFYKARLAHYATSSNKPPNSTYWTSADAPTVQSLIDVNLDGITLYSSASDQDNSAVIRLYRKGIQIDAETITMSNVVADTLVANSSITSPNIKDPSNFCTLKFESASGYGRMLYGLSSSGQTPTTCAFGVLADPVGGTNYIYIAGKPLIRSTTGSSNVYVGEVSASGSPTFKCYGTWDFRGATVYLPESE